MSQFHLGMDIGSVSANTVILNEKGQVIQEDYRRTKGQPMETAVAVLEECFREGGGGADGVLQHGNVHDAVRLGHTSALAEVSDGLGGVAPSPQA